MKAYYVNETHFIFTLTEHIEDINICTVLITPFEGAELARMTFHEVHEWRGIHPIDFITASSAPLIVCY